MLANFGIRRAGEILPCHGHGARVDVESHYLKGTIICRPERIAARAAASVQNAQALEITRSQRLDPRLELFFIQRNDSRILSPFVTKTIVG